MRLASALNLAVVLVCFLSTASATFPLGCYFVRQVDGTCNNLLNREWGAAEQLLRRGPEGTWWQDDIEHNPIVTPNVRTVSNELFRGDESILSPWNHNILWTFFGQFVGHDTLGVHRRGDLDESQIGNESDPLNYIFIPVVQPNDALYLQGMTRNYTRVLRSRGEFVNGKFEVGSDSTSFFDLDGVYGKKDEVTDLLRSFQDGKLISKDYFNYTVYPDSESNVPSNQLGDFPNWMPLMHDVDPVAPHTIPISSQGFPAATRNIPHRFFATGDGRFGENYGLHMFHGLFFREHNRLATQIKAANPWWNDEMIFQQARKINIAQYQNIVLYEWGRGLLRDDFDNTVGEYQGYNPFLNPTINHLMAFALRFGHTTVPSGWSLKNACNLPAFNSSRDGPRTAQSGRNQMPADHIAQVGKPSNVLHAMLFQKSGKIDVQFPESLRTVRGANIDTIANNQLRAADNGVPDYHTVRKLYYGGPHANLYLRPGCFPANENSPAPDPIGCFNYINSNTTVASTLRSLYGKINKINFYTSVVAEEPSTAALGRTSARVIADHFRRAREGDRWWFEGEWANFSNSQLAAIKATKMHTLIRRNFPEVNVQDNAFYVPAQPDHFADCQELL